MVGLGEKKGTLLVNFHNKEKVNEFTRETIRRDNVQIAYEDLTPTPGVFQRTEADFNSLMSQAPEQMNDYEYTDEELAEIEKLRNQAYMDDDSGERVAWEPVKPEELSGKALAHFGATRRELVSRVAQALRVPRQAQKEFLKPIADQIAAEYLCNGTVSREIRDRLFDTAWEQGRVVDQEFYDRYKEVKDYLRTTGVTLSERYQGDIPDYNDFRKRSFGSVKIVNDGLPVDVAWMELQEMAPELFPEDIANPADQLQHMANVAGSIRKVEKTLDEHYGSDAAEMKQSSRDDFDDAVRYAIGRLRQVKQVADERRVERDVIASEKGEKSETDIAALYPRLKDARRAVEKAVAKNLLTKDGDLQVRRLLCHDIRPEDLNPARDDLKGILAVYEAKAKYEEIARQIRNWNRAKKAKLAQEAEEHLREAGRIADKKVGFLYSRETMERNIRDIVEDPEAAERIIRTYFKPVHDGAAAATRLKDDYRQRVKELGISRKVKKGDQVSEAYAVQLYGESQDIIEMMEKSRGRIKTRDGKTLAEWKETQRQLWEQNRGIDKEKVQSAVAEFRKIYDELFTRMNEVRIRNGYEPVNYRHGYFPHFQQEGRDGVMGLFGRALGIDTAVTALPTTINGMTHTFKPGIRWFGNAMERQGFETAYDAIEGFDRYIEGIADVICQTDNIQRLRALANQMRYRTSDKGLQEQIDKIRERDDLTEPEREAIIKDKFENGKFELSNFVVELEEYTNLLANKKSRADRNMEQAMPSVWNCPIWWSWAPAWLPGICPASRRKRQVSTELLRTCSGMLRRKCLLSVVFSMAAVCQSAALCQTGRTWARLRFLRIGAQKRGWQPQRRSWELRLHIHCSRSAEHS